MERQPRWSCEVSVRTTAEQLAPFIESIRRLDPAVSVRVTGPSEIGVCLVRVQAPIARREHVNEVFEAFERDYPGSILMDFKE
jgi:hypothetical protein